MAHNLKKHIFNLWNPPFNIPVYIVVKLEDNFTKRWDMTLKVCAHLVLGVMLAGVLAMNLV
jgi:hypothetical protein